MIGADGPGGSATPRRSALISTWYREYISLLKGIEMEEILDLVLYRPLAFLVMKCLAPTPVTANQVTFASLACGVFSGYAFWQGTPGWGLVAAAAYFACNVLDCADGQLARLRGTASPLGYALDGSIDYLAGVAVFVGMAHSLVVQQPDATNWWLVAGAAGGCYAWQCAILDRKRREWGHRVLGRRSDAAQEEQWVREQLARYRQSGGHWLDRIAARGYLLYGGAWNRVLPKSQSGQMEAAVHAEAWADCHRIVLRLALWLGPSFQMSLIMLAGATNRMHWYLIGTLTVGNLFAIVVLLVEREANRRFSRLTRELAVPVPVGPT